jgi:hypothetical protein
MGVVARASERRQLTTEHSHRFFVNPQTDSHNTLRITVFGDEKWAGQPRKDCRDPFPELIATNWPNQSAWVVREIHFAA